MKNIEKQSLNESQREETESRIISDSDLIKGGAHIQKDGSLKLTPYQVEKKRLEEGTPYYEEVTVGGVEMEVGYSDFYEIYSIYFPQVDVTSERANDKNVVDRVILISDFEQDAKKAFEFAKSEAKKQEGTEEDVYDLYKKVENFRSKGLEKEK